MLALMVALANITGAFLSPRKPLGQRMSILPRDREGIYARL